MRVELQKGQRFVVLRDIGANCSVRVAPLLSELRPVTVPAGEILVVVFDDRGPDSPVLFVRPRRYEALEVEFVEPELRQRPEYCGYSLEVERDDFDEHCKLLDQRA